MRNIKTIFIICSKRFYGEIRELQNSLEAKQFKIIPPNYIDNPETEAQYRGTDMHANWVKDSHRLSIEKINQSDAVLVYNQSKITGENYIGGATLIEMYEAFRQGKQVILMYESKDSMLSDEIIGMTDKIINGDITNLE